MALPDKYISLLTDFGFKRVFGTEPNKAILIDFCDELKLIYIQLPNFKKTIDHLDTHLDKWLFLLKHLAQLSDRPNPLQEGIFSDLFAAAEIANFS